MKRSIEDNFTFFQLAVRERSEFLYTKMVKSNWSR